MNKQNGFTLVEIAIVIVIIGLLLGGVLKGQQIILDAKIKNLDNQFNGTTAAYYTYLDRYRALAGDHRTATTYFSGVTNGDGNRRINEAFDSTAADTDESRLFWLHLRSAGLVTGAPNDPNQPSNPFGGIVGVSSGDGATATNGQRITKLFVGFSDIPNNIAFMLDTRGDDANPMAGAIQANPAAYIPGDTDTLFSVFFKM